MRFFNQLDVEISNTVTFINITDFLLMASNSTVHFGGMDSIFHM